MSSGGNIKFSLPSHFSVIAGLDPAIHPLRRFFRRLMDTRVKPAYDANLHAAVRGTIFL
jgi:hypothetical protein